MDYGSTTWLGKAGAGFSGSLIGGGSVYQLNMWNMAGGQVPIPVLIVGKRVGLSAQVDMGHCVCLMTGVSGPHAFSEIRSRGVDWALSLGKNVDSVVKSSGQVGQLFLDAARHTGNWAAQESAKKAVQAVMGDFTIRPSGPSFTLLPTPLSVGIGAGIFYEWQTLTQVGSDVAWRYVKPDWWLENSGGGVTLHMSSIPEKDDSQIGLQFRVKRFGSDDQLIFDSSRTGLVNMRRTNRLTTVLGRVREGRLVDPSSGTFGLNLSSLVPVGRRKIGMLSVSRDDTVTRNGTLQIGLSVNRSATSETNLYKWESRNYATIRTDQDGKFSSAADTRHRS